ncbi:hypothetical protein ACQ4PT_037358 [Festuca glaucescens]
MSDSAHLEPPAKKRNIDPIAPTNHPWNLPATVDLVHRCDCPEDSVLLIPREANLRIGAEAKRVVARVSQAVVAVASIDGSAGVSPSFCLTYCRPTMRVFGANLHNARSASWLKLPTSLYKGFDGFLVELTSRAVKSAGLQQKDLIVECNGEPVATSLQLFEFLADNIGKMVEVAFVKAEDNSRRSVYLPVEEIPEGDFYSWPISQYDVY